MMLMTSSLSAQGRWRHVCLYLWVAGCFVAFHVIAWRFAPTDSTHTLTLPALMSHVGTFNGFVYWLMLSWWVYTVVALFIFSILSPAFFAVFFTAVYWGKCLRWLRESHAQRRDAWLNRRMDISVCNGILT